MRIQSGCPSRQLLAWFRPGRIQGLAYRPPHHFALALKLPHRHAAAIVTPDRLHSSTCRGRTVDAAFHRTMLQHGYRRGDDELTEHLPVK
ncbi:hypothetical protein [Streptomyces sp. NBC_01727]|uniref:hypothetical protein n=1 Tax=unclassified Streptomyces TaxID=2593676 RepID=UPI002E121534|nr:hypothetical protein OIE76_37555 [Streptomyces sp. NBC_01727]